MAGRKTQKACCYCRVLEISSQNHLRPLTTICKGSPRGFNVVFLHLQEPTFNLSNTLIHTFIDTNNKVFFLVYTFFHYLIYLFTLYTIHSSLTSLPSQTLTNPSSHCLLLSSSEDEKPPLRTNLTCDIKSHKD